MVKHGITSTMNKLTFIIIKFTVFKGFNEKELSYMKKIVFFDIDGTLLDHEKSLPASTKKALKLLKENGVFVAIATGRAPFMFESLRLELEIDSFVSFNGQFVVFENEVIYENPLNEAELHRLSQDAKETNIR